MNTLDIGGRKIGPDEPAFIIAEAGVNHNGDPKLAHRLVDAAAATSDEAEQAQLYAEAQVIVRDSVPLIPLDYGQRWWLSREGLRGDGISGVGILRYADLEWAG